jgi:alpha,alpha-trehalase
VTGAGSGEQVAPVASHGKGGVADPGSGAWVLAYGDVDPGTYVAGVYDRVRSSVDGRSLEDESIVNLPNWFSLT